MIKYSHITRNLPCTFSLNPSLSDPNLLGNISIIEIYIPYIRRERSGIHTYIKGMTKKSLPRYFDVSTYKSKAWGKFSSNTLAILYQQIQKFSIQGI